MPGRAGPDSLRSWPDSHEWSSLAAKGAIHVSRVLDCGWPLPVLPPYGSHWLRIAFDYDEPGKKCIIIDNDPFGDDGPVPLHVDETLVEPQDYWRLELANPLTFDHVLNILDALWENVEA